MITNRTKTGEPIEASGHVALHGAGSSTPTLAELHEVAAHIGRENPVKGERVTKNAPLRSRPKPWPAACWRCSETGRADTL